MTVSSAPSAAAETIDLGMAARIAMVFSAGLPSFAMSGLTPILPAIAAYFADYPNIGALTRLMVSIIGAAIIVGSPVAGLLADRYGRRGILLGGLLLYCAAGIAGFFLDNLYALLASRALVGLATAAIGALVMTIVVSHSVGTARNRWLGYTNTVATICSLTLVALSGFLGKFDWRWPFLIHLLALPLFVLTIIGLAPDRPDNSDTTASVPLPRLQEWPWWLLAFSTAGGVVIFTPLLYIPFHLKDIGVADPGRIGVAMAVLTTGSIIISMLYSRIRAVLSLGTTFMSGFGILAAGLIMDAMGTAYAVELVGQFTAGCGITFISVSVFALAAQTGPDSRRALTVGLAKGGLYVGPLVGQVMFEPIVARSDSGWGLMMIGAFSAALAVFNACFIFVRRVQPA